MSEGTKPVPGCIVCGRPAEAAPAGMAPPPGSPWGVMLPLILFNGRLELNDGAALCMPCLADITRQLRAAQAARREKPKVDKPE